MTPPLPLARELWEMLELVEEILVRIPPDEPACLIRASLACKPWCRLLSGHAFRRRYRTLHRTPPILGFLQSWHEHIERFVPTTKFRPRNPKRRDTVVIDCRHGRVLVRSEFHGEDEEVEDEGKKDDDNDEEDDDVIEEEGEEEDDVMEEEEEDEVDGEEEEKEDYLKLVVWDPVSGSRWELRDPDIYDPYIHERNYEAAVLCAADGCDHDDCNLGPFSMAFICINDDDDEYESYEEERLASASVYSSVTREWTSPIHILIGEYGARISGKPSVVVGQVVYALIEQGQYWIASVLKYDFGTHSLSVINLPGLCNERPRCSPLLVSAKDSRLGVVNLQKESRLCTMWSMEVSLDGKVSWILLREMDLAVLPLTRNLGSDSPILLVGCVEGTDIIIAVTDLGAFTINLKSMKLRKLSSKPYKDTILKELSENLFLYMSFNNPPGVGVEAEARASEVGRGDAQV